MAWKRGSALDSCDNSEIIPLRSTWPCLIAVPYEYFFLRFCKVFPTGIRAFARDASMKSKQRSQKKARHSAKYGRKKNKTRARKPCLELAAGPALACKSPSSVTAPNRTEAGGCTSHLRAIITPSKEKDSTGIRTVNLDSRSLSQSRILHRASNLVEERK